MHQCCLVILKENENLEEVLEPFNKCTENEAYLEFEDMTEEVLKEYEEEKKSNKNSDLSKFLKDNGYIEEHGRYGYKINLDGHWDWWAFGGRWENYLKLREGIKNPDKIILGRGNPFDGRSTHCSACLKEDFDYEGMRRLRYADAVKSWEEHKKHPEKDSYWNYGIYKDEKKKDFLNRMKNTNMFYSILKDGEWYTKEAHEECNWRAIEEQLINSANDKDRYVILDCHY